jgi:methylated-DNA-protein-cysteine methyltransferase-like protein
MDRGERARRIIATVRDIPSGQVASYGQVAELSGIPRGARQVGRVLRELPAGEDLPWHRVLRASGHVAFPEGSRGYREQVRRLIGEDVPVCRGRVNMAKWQWQPDLDELIWKHAMDEGAD